ncbi:MAG: hydroxymethylbilane synthase [Gemmataceae bacterium]
MSLSPIRIGTRSSPLALWQAHYIADRLRPVAAPRPVDIVHIETHGDRDQASALSSMGGFGVFTKSIQQSLLDGRADLAVHSLKDLPTIPTPGVAFVAVPPRGPTGDAFLSRTVSRFDDLPLGATVGTSSLRRRAMMANRRPDLKLVDLRGNVDTRLRKLDDLKLDGIVLAEAGLFRLGLSGRMIERLDPEWMLPAVGQGAIGLECRESDVETRHLAEALTDPETWARVGAERAFLATLGGGCLVPIGATSVIEQGTLILRGMVLSPDGVRKIVATHRGSAATPLAVGQELAGMLLNAGAAELLPPAV